VRRRLQGHYRREDGGIQSGMPRAPHCELSIRLGSIATDRCVAQRSIVPALVGIVGKPATLPVGSYVVLGITFVVGVAATIAQLRYADNAQ
jgi:hypothetical protein